MSKLRDRVPIEQGDVKSLRQSSGAWPSVRRRNECAVNAKRRLQPLGGNGR
jgi:hypothetical protein